MTNFLYIQMYPCGYATLLGKFSCCLSDLLSSWNNYFANFSIRSSPVISFPQIKDEGLNIYFDNDSGLVNGISLKDVTPFIGDIFLFGSTLFILLLGLFLSTSNNYIIAKKHLGRICIFFLIITLFIHTGITFLDIKGFFFNNILYLDNNIIYIKMLMIVLTIIIIGVSEDFFQKHKIGLFEYDIMLLFTLLGAGLLLSAHDIVSCFLCIELVSFPSYVLACVNKTHKSTEAGFKYFIIGSFSSSMLLFGFSVIFLLTGHQNFSDIYAFLLLPQPGEEIQYKGLTTESVFEKFRNRPKGAGGGVSTVLKVEDNNVIYEGIKNFTKLIPIFPFPTFDIMITFTGGHRATPINPDIKHSATLITSPDLNDNIDFVNFRKIQFLIISISVIVILSALFLKLAIAPFHFWVADIYEGVLLPTAFFLSTIPKISIFFLFYKLFSFVFINVIWITKPFLIAVCLSSLVLGSLGALRQQNIKRFLGFSSVNHFGFILTGLVISTPESIEASFFYFWVYIFLTTSMWTSLIVIVDINRINNKYVYSELNRLTQLSGLLHVNKYLSVSIFTNLLSLGGMPCLLGFFAKAGIFVELSNEVTNLFNSRSILFFAFFSLLLVIILSSIISLVYYTRLWKIIYVERIGDVSHLVVRSGWFAFSVNAIIFLLNIFACLLVFPPSS